MTRELVAKLRAALEIKDQSGVPDDAALVRGMAWMSEGERSVLTWADIRQAHEALTSMKQALKAIRQTDAGNDTEGSIVQSYAAAIRLADEAIARAEGR